ncbi:MAG TPA: TIGR03118 family protein [Gaiellaceae bacterium]|nr:TIGR03118 family protein [Gaiellaceae bacterium]
MKRHPSARWPTALLGLALVLVSALVAVSPLGAAEKNAYTVTPLVSDQAGVAAHTDPNLVNAWGLTASGASPWWVSDNGKDLSTLYRGDGTPQSLVVDVAGGPTGTVFNPTSGFLLPTGGKALFLFDSEDGIVRGWNAAQGTTAKVVADRSSEGAIYKGLAIADTASGPRLYAADFHNARIDVFNGSFGLVPGGFEDPALLAGYAPFNVQTIGDRVFVAYAKQDEDAEDEVAGQGAGFVDAYDLAGNLLGRVAQHGQLNAPWGLALAPGGFGRFGGDLLVGNFGDGQINAYEELPNGHFEHRGELRGSDGKPLTIDGLWALRFGNGGNAGPTGTLFFTAGPDEESHGLFGSITAD